MASLDSFLQKTREAEARGGRFECESARMLRIDVHGGVWIKPGAAVAYRGQIAFERRPTMTADSPRDAALREMAPIVRARGSGRLYCASRGRHVHDLLAFEESLSFEQTIVDHGVSVAAGGLVVVKLSGDGTLAVATHGTPLTLTVTANEPVSTDPHATVAWSGSLTPSLKTDLTWRSVIGHGGHEPIQLLFEGAGFVIVQPFEDPGRFHVTFEPLKRIKTLV
jgi:uncharacterized protein (AIM24 family)